ncbi:DUF2585 domain-containing protein [Sphingomonas sediminicola]|uniref:DUF2585 domain-containing protein n=1 Tax=Sphingomonas sediminicola TaxID=386874 RepID=A0ABX6T7Q3_9SPHN|nr:DUF2585 family protein [Sphingomonas sediminicola]QNP45877.1 DUF2585 domain-containing protein [Sphingomonas sediminicola]
MTRSKRAAVAAIVLLAATAMLLYLMGRPPICTCGAIDLWVGEPNSSRTSQMLSDWYSPSHIVHGFLFFAGLWLVGRRWPLERRFLIALAIEAAWEIVENTPLIINRYREETAALGYTGDSVLNSISDIAMMIGGFLVARRLPVWASVAIVLVLELVPLFVIRDNLTLNVWMLLAPNEALKAWQSGGSASALIAHFMH